jgi:integrase
MAGPVSSGRPLPLAGSWAPPRRATRQRLHRFVASVAIAAGHDAKTVADRLGHANSAMTYAHAVAKSDRAVADSVGALFESDE